MRILERGSKAHLPVRCLQLEHRYLAVYVRSIGLEETFQGMNELHDLSEWLILDTF